MILTLRIEYDGFDSKNEMERLWLQEWDEMIVTPRMRGDGYDFKNGIWRLWLQ